jgi:hypothetical protein
VLQRVPAGPRGRDKQARPRAARSRRGGARGGGRARRAARERERAPAATAKRRQTPTAAGNRRKPPKPPQTAQKTAKKTPRELYNGVASEMLFSDAGGRQLGVDVAALLRLFQARGVVVGAGVWGFATCPGG